MNHQLNADLLYQIEERRNAPRSSGERTVEEYLKFCNIYFTTEQFFEDLRSPSTGLFLFFDFYIPRYKVAIEVQGYHHYYGRDGEETRVIKLDKVKEGYCKRNGIKLIKLYYRNRVIDVIGLSKKIKAKEKKPTVKQGKKKWLRDYKEQIRKLEAKKRQ